MASAAPFQVKGFIDSQQMKQALTYSLADLSSAMMEQPGLYAHYGQLQADAERQVSQIKLLLEVEEGRADKTIREEAVAAGEKVTEPQIEKRIARQPKVLSIKKALISAQHVVSLAKTAVKAFEQRRDMLIQTGSTQRKEMEGEVRISTRNAHEQVAEDQRQRVLERFKPRDLHDAPAAA